MHVCICNLPHADWHLHEKPKTMRLGAIIEQTAARIASNNQFEVFLKVKQAGNPAFSFLNDSADDLHPYFLYLKDKHEDDKSIPDTLTEQPGENALASTNGETSANPLSGLLGDYASSSDESVNPTTNDEIGESNMAQGKTEEVNADHKEKGAHHDSEKARFDQKRKQRADRLKQWKEARLKQNDKNSEEGTCIT